MINDEPSPKKNGKFRIHLESESLYKKHTFDIEFGYTKNYPCKSPQIKIISSNFIEPKAMDEILGAVRSQAEEIARNNSKFPDSKEVMIFTLMQTAKEKLDAYVQKIQPIVRMEPIREKPAEPIIEDKKPSQYHLPDFINKVDAEKERLKQQGIGLKYVRFNLELPPLEDPEELKYKNVENPSRSRYRNEFEEINKLGSGHTYLVKNKIDRLIYAVKKVFFVFINLI